jgi:hypothetical protein
VTLASTAVLAVVPIGWPPPAALARAQAQAQEADLPALPLPDCHEVGNEHLSFDPTVDCEGAVGVFDAAGAPAPPIDPSELALTASVRQLDFRLPDDRGGDQVVTFHISRVRKQHTDPATGYTHETAMVTDWPVAFFSSPFVTSVQQRKVGGTFEGARELRFDRVGECPGGRDGVESCAYRVTWQGYQEGSAARVDEPIIWRVELPWLVQRYVDKHDGDPFPDEFNYGSGRSLVTFRTDPPPPLQLQAEVRRLGPARLEFTSVGSGPDVVARDWYHFSRPSFPLEFGSQQVSFIEDFATDHPEIPAGSHSEIRILVTDRWGRTAQQLLPFSLLSQVGTKGPLAITGFEVVGITGGVAQLRAVVENTSASAVADVGLVGSRAPAGAVVSTPASVPSIAPGATVEFSVTVPVDDLERFTVDVEAFGSGTSGPVRSGTATADVEVTPSTPGETSTTQAAQAGDDRVEVASQDGFDVGDHVRIGEGADEEVRRIAGFGSLIFASPLGRDHATGSPVAEVEPPGGDVAGPVISVTAPLAGQVVVEGEDATLAYTCADPGVGVEECGGSGPDTGSALDTATPGDHQVVVEAWDRNGNPSSTTVSYTVASLANRRFVDAAHHDLLDRAATTAELDLLGVALDRGTRTRASVVAALTDSVEWSTSVIGNRYRTLLEREPDPGGLAYWSGQLHAGRRSLESISVALLASPEHLRRVGGGDRAGWVDALYRQVLGRSPDPGGRAHWLASTASRSRIAASIYQSREGRARRVDGWYDALLGRPPEGDARTFWTARLLVTGELELVRYLAASEEYLAKAQPDA